MNGFGLERCVFLENGREYSIVAGDEGIKVCGRICKESGLTDIRDEIVNIYGVDAPKGARNGWLR